MEVTIIFIILSDKAYENDVYPLAKAFYPAEAIKIYSRDEYNQLEQDINSLFFGVAEDTSSFKLNIEFSENQISIQSRKISNAVEILELTSGLTKPQYKNAMKRFLYELFSKNTGRTLPWGILTGIRPAKLVSEMLEEGRKENDIRNRMQKDFLCSEGKLDVSLKIAERELELLSEIEYKKGYSLYIGIPFCPTTCLYCSFTSYSIAKYANIVEDYLNALEKEIKYAATCFPDKKLTTVYFGGGTPTTLSAEQLDRILGLLRIEFDFTDVKEFCVEAGRPDSITKEKLQVLKKWGVDRISINPQSMQQKTLDIIGRRHSVEAVKDAFLLARQEGHNNINMDIIIGLPGENPEDVENTLNQIKEMNPDSLTVHTLAIKRAARLNIEKENYADLKASEVPKMLEQTMNFMRDNNYLPYYLYRQKNMTDNLENVGYAHYGKEGLYNILIMEEKQTILALGAGGMSKFVFYEENRIERVDNVKSVTDYIDRIDEMISRKKDFLKENLL